MLAKCYGPEASHYTKARFQYDTNGNNCAGSQVQIETAGIDKYGRTLGYIWIKGVLYNEDLTVQGFALYNEYGEKHQYSDRIQASAIRA
jgi:endonuclease YncB( thermonuclease family)